MKMLAKEDGVMFKTTFEDQVFVVEFSPYEWSKNLLCIGLANNIVIAAVTFPEEVEEEDEEDESDSSSDGGSGFNFSILKEFVHKFRIQALAWGPDTSLKGLPRVLSFAAADSTHMVSVYTSDLGEDSSVQQLKGHTDYVNALAFDPEGSILASVSDDLTCQLWNLRDSRASESEAIIWLTSPGMAVCWHPADPSKLLVGEKSGLLQMYNASNQQPIVSLDAGQVPLMAAHWAPSNSMSVAALAGGELLLWDLQKPSRAVEVRTVHAQGGRWLRFCSSSDQVVATLGRPGHELKVCNMRAKMPMIAITLPLASGLTWHQQLPYVCISSDKEVQFRKVATK